MLRALAPLLLLALAGCAALPAYPIAEERAATNLALRPGLSVRLSTSIRREVNDRPFPPSSRTDEKYRSSVARAFADLGIERIDAQNPDLIVDVEVLHRGRAPLPLILLTGLTLFVSPSWSSSEYVVDTRIRWPNDATPIGESSAAYSFRSYYHLVLLPLVATNAEGAVENGVVFGLTRRALAEAIEKAADVDPRLRLP
jgi:hypothetical protein